MYNKVPYFQDCENIAVLELVVIHRKAKWSVVKIRIPAKLVSLHPIARQGNDASQ